MGKTKSKPSVTRHCHGMGTACYVWISLQRLEMQNSSTHSKHFNLENFNSI